ncbi:MAG: TonB family protein [Candidatus Kapabacteria bacterium]|nr:TonB family protein [Candidatus Kapabacteria bacterium]
MFQSSSKEDRAVTLNIKIPWDKYTARGYFVSLLVLLLFYFLSPFMQMDKPQPIRERVTIPIQLLNFGSGDGTGLRSGNLTKEGAKAKGETPKVNIQDAEQTPKDAKVQKSTPKVDIADAGRFNPVKKTTTETKTQSDKGGTGQQNIGAKNGDAHEGSGLGKTGTGKGAGDGFGDINWGGGGNRIVQHKELPKFPKNVNNSAQIVLRFKVLPDGTVSSIVPTQKGDPALELAAVNALKKWRFNPLKDDSPIMIGTIPITFILR